MAFFLLAYLAVYGSMQAVVLLRLQPLLPHGLWPRLLFGLLLGFMVAAPILSRLLERADQLSLAAGLAWAGYTWMGFAFLCFCLGGGLFLLEGGLSLGSRLLDHGPFRLPGRASALLVLAACLLLAVYGAFESRQLRVERVSLSSDKLAPGRRLTLVQISDLHLGFMSSERRVERVVQRIEALDPDLIVCTGDLLDGSPGRLHRAAELLAGLSPPLGAYAVSGNHETYAGLEVSWRFIERAGFRPLRDKALRVGEAVTLVGLDFSRRKRCAVEEALLEKAGDACFTIVLKHSPEVCRGSLGRMDLQLSGHTHKGQIFPFNLVVALVYPYVSGLHAAGGGSSIYVSRGTGTWGPQMRLLAPPEVTLVEIAGRGG